MSRRQAAFFASLYDGIAWQKYVTAQLCSRGVPCFVGSETPIESAVAANDSQADRESFYDEADIVLTDGRIVEVKSRNIRFTCVADFPFETIAVDTVDGYERKKRKPAAYVTVSIHTKAILGMTLNTPESWTAHRTTDFRRGSSSDTYYCRTLDYLDIDDFANALIF